MGWITDEALEELFSKKPLEEEDKKIRVIKIRRKRQARKVQLLPVLPTKLDCILKDAWIMNLI